MKSSNQLKYLQINNPPQQTSKSHKMKPIFQHHATWKCIQPSDISYINKYKPKMLSLISISHLRSENIGFHGLRNLRKAFSNSKTISSAFFDNPIANAKQLQYLLDSTNHWRDLSFISQERTSPLNQEFIKALSRLGRCKELSDLAFPNLSTQQHINKRIATRIYQQLKQLNQLKRLSVSLPFYSNTAIMNYKLPRSLTSLHLDFKSKDLMNQQQISSFIRSIQYCHLLEQFTLTFSRGYLIELSDAEIWASFFQNTPKPLKNLHLNLHFSGDQPPEGIQAFIESLKHLKDLTSLNLSSFHPWIMDRPISFEDAYFPSVFNSLQSLTQLETLELKLYSYKNIENNGVQQLASMLQCLKNLKKLVIQFPFFLFPGEGLTFISQALKQLTNLKVLDLRSPHCFSHLSVHNLLNSITHHRHLTYLTLDLPSSAPIFRSSIPSSIKRGLAKLCQSYNRTPFFSDLRNFAQLSTLKLQLSGIHNSSQEWKALSLSLPQLKKLSSLHLSFQHFDSANSFKDLHQFLFCFKNLPQLAQLELNFEGNKISDREVEILSSHLVECQSLSTLNLQFKKGPQLKDETLCFLLSGIRGLLKLKDLTLLLEKKEVFSENAVSDFLEGLVVLKELSTFYFIYSQGSIKWNDNAPLPQNLKGYENLRHMTHFVVNCSRYI